MVFRPAHLLCLLLAAPASAAVCGHVSDEARIAAVAPGGEVVFADGRRARFGGLALGAKAQSALGERQGAEVGVVLFAPRPDRWGRLIVDLVGADGRSLGLDLVERGLARVRPEPETRACEAERLDAEAGARAAGEGLWAEAGAVLDASDAAGLARADGRFSLVSGVVRRVGEGRAKVYLDFSGRDGFAVVVRRKAEPQFRRAGVDLKALAGQRVLVRGVLDVRFGPRIEIADPAMIEPLDPRTGRGG
jgi:hypothetical protein